MPKTVCSDCGTSVPAGTNKCPECGKLQASKPRVTMGAIGVLIAAVVIVIGAISIVARDDPANPAGDTTEITP